MLINNDQYAVLDSVLGATATWTVGLDTFGGKIIAMYVDLSTDQLKMVLQRNGDNNVVVVALTDLHTILLA